MYTGVYLKDRIVKKSPPELARRPRNSVVTKEAIVQSALTAFSRAGYDGVGLREIAREASITPALISRYFGSKEDFFAAVVEVAFQDNRLFHGDLATLSQRVAAAMIEKTKGKTADRADSLQLIIRSAANDRAMQIIRTSIERHFEGPLASTLAGKATKVRAALFLVVIAGFQLMSSIIASSALTDPASRDELAERLESLLQVLVAPNSGNHRPGSR